MCVSVCGCGYGCVFAWVWKGGKLAKRVINPKIELGHAFLGIGRKSQLTAEA